MVIKQFQNFTANKVLTNTRLLFVRALESRLGRARSGHVTGQRSLRGRGSCKELQRAPTNTMLFSDYHLAKLNPKCHMNYLD